MDAPIPYADANKNADLVVPARKRNAELINGLIGMDLGRLNAIGKRGNAELINGLLGMELDRLDRLGRRR